MSDQPTPLTPPAGYDSWISYTIDWVDELLNLLNDDSRKPVVAAAKAELESLRKSHAELELKCARANESLDYAIALQRAIEYACCGKQIPDDIACKCPHHAKKLNAQLFNLKAALERIYEHVVDQKTWTYDASEMQRIAAEALKGLESP